MRWLKDLGAGNLILIGVGPLLIVAIFLWTAGLIGPERPNPALTALAQTPSPGAFVDVPASTPTPDTATAGPADRSSATPRPATGVEMLDLPPLTPGPGGQVYSVTPPAGAAGWVRAGDGAANHLDDYNVYAGTYEGRQYVGAVQFDLAGIAPGARISYADLVLVGLSDEWLTGEGSWRVQLLQPWMDDGWATRTITDLMPVEVADVDLGPPLPAAELAAGRPNVLVLGRQALDELEARVYGGRVSFRILGPASGGDNLFSWDSGYGRGSHGWTPVLRVVAGSAPAAPLPSPTRKLAVVTLTPTPGNWATAVARAVTEATRRAAYGTPTPFPAWVATATPGVVVVTSTPWPLNPGTATAVSARATIAALLTGTYTPVPPSWMTPTPLPLLIPFEDLTATPTPTPTPTPGDVPAALRGKIAFLSDRLGEPQIFVMDPDGSHVAWLTQGAYYAQALARDRAAPDGRQRVVVQPDAQGNSQLGITVPGGSEPRIITAGKGRAVEPAWSPAGSLIVFVSNEPGNDEIYSIDAGGGSARRLTSNGPESDRHPSWSADGRQIVFYSNRSAGRRQIWIMAADGSGARNLSQNRYNDWDPVWIK